MKYLRLFESFEDIEQICKQYNITDYTINTDESIDVNENVCISNKYLTKIELLNDFDIFRDEDTDKPAIVMDRLNDFLLTIGKDPVKKVYGYKNI